MSEMLTFLDGPCPTPQRANLIIGILFSLIYLLLCLFMFNINLGYPDSLLETYLNVGSRIIYIIVPFLMDIECLFLALAHTFWYESVLRKIKQKSIKDTLLVATNKDFHQNKLDSSNPRMNPE